MQDDLRPGLTQQEWNDLSYTLDEKLIAYLDRPKFDAEHDRAYRLFFRESVIEDPPFLDEIERLAFYDYLINQHRLESSGKTLVGHFLEENRMDLSPEERTLLENRLASRYSIYEVQEVEPGQVLLLKDLFQEDVREVHEVSGSLQLFKWDVLAANIYKVGEQYQISGSVITIPRDMVDSIQSGLLEEYHRYQEKSGQLDFPSFLKDRAYLVSHWVAQPGID